MPRTAPPLCPCFREKQRGCLDRMAARLVCNRRFDNELPRARWTTHATPPRTLVMLSLVAEGVWTSTQALRFYGVDVGARMTVVGLPSQSLLVHSPIALTAALRDSLDALGRVAVIVAPNKFHHLFVGDWARAYPEALVYGCPGLSAKRPDIAWNGVLGDEPHEAWDGVLQSCVFSALPMQNEVVFFHGSSRTVVASDFMFHLSSHPSRWTRTVARLAGNGSPGPTYLERLAIRDRTLARAQVDKICSWGADRLIVAHGEILPHGATKIIELAYAWL